MTVKEAKFERTKEKLNYELQKLDEAMRAITTIWHEETELCDVVLCNVYPFKASFDELSSDVSVWVSDGIEEIKAYKPKS